MLDGRRDVHEARDHVRAGVRRAHHELVDGARPLLVGAVRVRSREPFTGRWFAGLAVPHLGEAVVRELVADLLDERFDMRGRQAPVDGARVVGGALRVNARGVQAYGEARRSIRPRIVVEDVRLLRRGRRGLNRRLLRVKIVSVARVRHVSDRSFRPAWLVFAGSIGRCPEGGCLAGTR